MRPRLSQKPRGSFNYLADIFLSLADSLKPPERLSVSQSAERHIRINRLGSSRPYSTETAPYMREPMNCVASPEFNAVVFAGPAQSSKTESLVMGSIGYSVMVDPMDMMLINPTQQNARDFSVLRIDKMHRDSPDIGSRVLKRRDADSKGLKVYKSGMLLFLSWPTISELSGKPIPRMLLTDYERMDDDIDGEGSPFDLARKRTTTFGSYAMTVAESSPGKPLIGQQWIAKTPHEAPPTKGGILSLFNRGDRRRLYWPCPHCGTYFEGRFEQLDWDTKENSVDSAETVRLICPPCGEKIAPDDRSHMLAFSMWLKDGQTIEADGRVTGRALRSKIASFWLEGVAAAFSSWQTLVQKFLDATQEYESTGDEGALRTFYNTDLGRPYVSKAQELQRLPEVLKGRAEQLPEREVPEGVRFLVGVVDVQKNMWVVQVFGVAPGNPFDLVVIDRFDIRKSERVDADGDHEWVKPATYLEDWDLLTEQVIKRTYPLADGSGRRMMIKMTACDSGGYAQRQHKEGVTTNAYNYYRKLKQEGLAPRFHLVKGDPTPSAPRTRISYPDAQRKDKLSAARGDVPVLLLNPNALKDMLAARLDCVEPGKGMLRIPDWMPDWFYSELCAETRTEKGWLNTARARNEAWDLSYYCIGLCISSLIRIENLKWNSAPAWCDEWDKNPLVLRPEQKDRFEPKPSGKYDFGKLGRALA